MRPLYWVCPASHRGTQRVESLHEPATHGIALSNRHQHADALHPLRLLRACRQRAWRDRAAEQSDEFA